MSSLTEHHPLQTIGNYTSFERVASQRSGDDAQSFPEQYYAFL